MNVLLVLDSNDRETALLDLADAFASKRAEGLRQRPQQQRRQQTSFVRRNSMGAANVLLVLDFNDRETEKELADAFVLTKVEGLQQRP